MSQHRVADLAASEVRAAVADRFSEVAEHPDEEFSFPIGRPFAEALDYPRDALDRVPAAAVASFAGASCLVPWYGDWSGLSVADLGCGAGLDTLLLSDVVGARGQVGGIDLSPAMAALARTNARAARAGNVSVCCGAVEALPIRAQAIDVAVANGVFNLSPEKPQAVREVFRMLRPGGVLLGAEIVLQRELPGGQGDDLEDWFR